MVLCVEMGLGGGRGGGGSRLTLDLKGGYRGEMYGSGRGREGAGVRIRMLLCHGAL